MATFIKGVKVTPAIIKENEDFDWSLHKNECGYHSYFSRNQTLIWLMNAKSSCEIEVRMLNTVKAALVFDIEISEFYKTVGESTFIDRLADRLNIKPW